MLVAHRINSTLAILILSIVALTSGVLIVHALKNATLSYSGSELVLTEVGD